MRCIAESNKISSAYCSVLLRHQELTSGWPVIVKCERLDVSRGLQQLFASCQFWIDVFDFVLLKEKKTDLGTLVTEAF